MNLLDEEVFAVIMAVTIIGSTLGIALVLKPEITEPFTSLGLLNQECKIGDYPNRVYPGQSLVLCVFIYNHRDYPALVQVRYKIGDKTTLPTNTTPSPHYAIKIYEFFVGVGENITEKISVPILLSDTNVDEVALIFELWIYDVNSNEWIYTGIWNHLYVNVIKVPYLEVK